MITRPVFPETFTLHCNIGMDAIQQGQPNDTVSCPIALSLWSAIYFNSNYQINDVEVNPESVTIRLTGKGDIVQYGANLPETGKSFVVDFDGMARADNEDYEAEQEFRRGYFTEFEMDLDFVKSEG